jgi:hypothetical protein
MTDTDPNTSQSRPVSLCPSCFSPPPTLAELEVVLAEQTRRGHLPLLLSNADRAEWSLSFCAANSSLLGGCHHLPNARKLPFFPHLGSGFNFYSILFNNNA